MKHDIYHFNYKNFSHQLRTMDNYSNIFADVMTERRKGFGLFQLIFRPLYKFIKVYIIKMGFLDGMPGLVLAVSNAFYIFVKYVKLWEREHSAAQPQPKDPSISPLRKGGHKGV
jgi:hypothetical protein